MALVRCAAMGDACKPGTGSVYQRARLRAAQPANAIAAKITSKLPIQKSNWGYDKSLIDHYSRHGADFGAKSPEEYANKSKEFLIKSQRENLPTKIDEKGTIRVYDASSNTFASYNSDGSTKTMFKPTSKNFWSRQPGNIQ